MIMPVVFLSLCAAIFVVVRVRRALRRRRGPELIVTTWPDIELSERYGGWNAGAYDAGTGRDRSPTMSYRRLADCGLHAASSGPGAPVRRNH